jgi:Helix-turn-helix domain
LVLANTLWCNAFQNSNRVAAQRFSRRGLLVIEAVAGVLLAPDDAQYVLDAFDSLLIDRRPSAQLADFIARFRRTAVKSGVSSAKTGVDASKFGIQQDSAHHAPYDVLDSGQAAAIIGITASGVRDLARRKAIPAHRAGGRWLYPAPAVVAYAERRAARRG